MTQVTRGQPIPSCAACGNVISVFVATCGWYKGASGRLYCTPFHCPEDDRTRQVGY